MGDPSTASSGAEGAALIGDKQVGLGLEVIDARGRSRNTAALVEVQVLRRAWRGGYSQVDNPWSSDAPGPAEKYSTTSLCSSSSGGVTSIWRSADRRGVDNWI